MVSKKETSAKATKSRRRSKKGAIEGLQVDLFAFDDVNAAGSLGSAPKQEPSAATITHPPLATTNETGKPSLTDHVEPPAIWSVTDLAHRFRDHLRDHFSSICVQGEIADFKGIHRSGHLYFALKDESSQIRAVMWKGSLSKVPFKIEVGMEVIVRGKLDFYGGSGSTQIVVEHMEPVGIGALQLKFEQLKEKLRQEGLFLPERKKPIPELCWRIGLVTGKSTAAFQDMQKVLRHRFPLAELFLFHAAVQGAAAPAEIVTAIQKANEWSSLQSKPLDVLIVGRGGGSYEDLFCFNEESVARAISQSRLPVVTGIGHEIDTTIADFVADYRAATPSHAISAVVPEISDWLRRIEDHKLRFVRRIQDVILDLAQKVDHFQIRLFNAAPHKQLEGYRQQVEGVQNRMVLAMRSSIDLRLHRVKSLAQVLDALSPLRVLDRGFAIVKTPQGALVRDAQSLRVGDEIDVQWSKNQIKAKVI